MKTATMKMFVGLVVASALRAHGGELIIQSFESTGALKFNNLTAAVYRVEWAPSAGGPWTNTWDHLAAISAKTNAATITVSVPMCYRVVADMLGSSMAAVPGGTFTIGDSFNEGAADELPQHLVTVDSFEMSQYEVTKALWDDVRAWAMTNGYAFDNAGAGKAANHPVQSVSWYDIVKWCNARSEKEGLSPCYYTSSATTTVYRTGQTDVLNDMVRWTASGYRLPTEAEWESAARAGFTGRRFSWGDVISHCQANYKAADSNDVYDSSYPAGYHPLYNDGTEPYTSPVGSFQPNAYGLYDMAGNVYEWCWDVYDGAYYSSSSVTNPLGPASGTSHGLRSGSWSSVAHGCRIARRGNTGHTGDFVHPYVGFRVVRRSP